MRKGIAFQFLRACNSLNLMVFYKYLAIKVDVKLRYFVQGKSVPFGYNPTR